MAGGRRVGHAPAIHAIAVATLVFAVCTPAPLTLRAQATLVARRSPCLDSIHAASLKRVPVYASAEIVDSLPVSAGVLSTIDLFTQADVEEIRTNFPMMRIRGYAGSVLMQFVIDTGGRAVPSSIRGLWPPNEPRLTGPAAFAYDSLVRAMRGTLHEARFVPARIGGCVVSQLAQQAFLYRPSR